MSKEQSYQNAASELLRLVGGKENVISAAHCATRLRLVLKDESKANVDGILKTELVKGQFSTGGQFQIIIGSGTVDEVYKYFIQYADIKESTKNEVKKALRSVIWIKYKIKDKEVFDKAYSYIEQYY